MAEKKWVCVPTGYTFNLLGKSVSLKSGSRESSENDVRNWLDGDWNGCYKLERKFEENWTQPERI